MCFLGTASGDSDSYIVNFYRAFPPSRCDGSHISLTTRDIDDLAPAITSQDVIYVGGGSTANLLALWRLHGVDELLRDAWENGVILCGSSAGAACWFEATVTDSFGPTLQVMRDGLGFLPGTFCPHYNSEEQRRPTLHRAISEGMPAGYAVDDKVALHFVDTELEEAVSPDTQAAAWWVEQEPSGAVTERVLPPRLI